MSNLSFYARLVELKPNHIKSDAEYARFLGIGKDIIGKWKLHHNAGNVAFLPTGKLLQRVADALGVSRAALIVDKEDK